jgi:hypothetical protein
MDTSFSWICPDCGMQNFEFPERDVYLCRDGDCGHEFKDSEITKVYDLPTALASLSYHFGGIIVSDCPYCHGRHEYQMPLGDGQREAGCLIGKYILKFD